MGIDAPGVGEYKTVMDKTFEKIAIQQLKLKIKEKFNSINDYD